MNAGHAPVMLEQVVELLAPQPGERMLDATTGLGGHAEQLAEAVGPQGLVIALDRDPEMLSRAAARLERFGTRVRLVQARFGLLRQVVEGAGLEAVDGVLLDLGVCSVHFDEAERGFSFQHSGPLDMRMDRSQGESAQALIERLDPDELAQLLRRGGAPAPRSIARAIKAAQPLRTTDELVRALAGVRLPRRRHHPATLVFQALRIAVNDEYDELESGLEAAVAVLSPGGRLAVLSYHSGEDRRVKEFLAVEAKGCICPPDLPVCGCGRSVRLRLRARGERATPTEIQANPRARSARLRGAIRC